jgi:alkaline phosphatase
LNETAELDHAVLTARRYAGAKSTIVVCGDVAIGGMSLNGAPFRKDSGIAVIGLNSAGQPWITWAAGPNGIRSYGAPKVPNQPPNDQVATEPAEPSAFYSKTALPTADDVIVFGSGRGTEALQGSIDHPAIFKILRDQL